MENTAYVSKTLFYNSNGEIVACLYVLENGNLHIDSWIKPYSGQAQQPRL